MSYPRALTQVPYTHPQPKIQRKIKYCMGKSRLLGKVGNKRLITDFLRRMRFGYRAVYIQLYRIRLVRTRLVIVLLRLAASRIYLVYIHLVTLIRSVTVPCCIGFAIYIVIYRTGERRGGTLVLDTVVQVYKTCTKRYSSTCRPSLGLTLPVKTSSYHYIITLALRSYIYVFTFALVVYWHNPSIETPIAAYQVPRLHHIRVQRPILWSHLINYRWVLALRPVKTLLF